MHVNAGLYGTLISAVTEGAAYISDNFGASWTKIKDAAENYYHHFCGVTNRGYSNRMPLFFHSTFWRQWHGTFNNVWRGDCKIRLWSIDPSNGNTSILNADCSVWSGSDMSDDSPFRDVFGTACYYRYDVAHMAYRLDWSGNGSSFQFGIKTCTYTNNSWSSWSSSYSSSSYQINCINDNGADIFVAVGDGGKILRSTNKGVSWTAQLLALRRT